MDIFNSKKYESLKFLSNLEKNGHLFNYIKENYPEYIEGNEVCKFMILDRIESPEMHFNYFGEFYKDKK